MASYCLINGFYGNLELNLLICVYMDNENEKVFKGLGKKLRDARERAGLTQLELAEKAGINANYYAVVERGEKNISYEKLERILKVLNIKSLDIS
jgi:ribosome-binding protein aMBF1 (putative translation factor)